MADCGAGGVAATTDVLPGSPRLGDGERDAGCGVGDAGDEGPATIEDALYALLAPLGHQYSTMNSPAADPEPPRPGLDQSQLRPSSKTTLRATFAR